MGCRADGWEEGSRESTFSIAAALLQACCQPLTHPQLYLPLPLQLAELVGTACQRLTAANVPHNLFIADCGARVFLFPNCFAEKKARGLIPEGEAH